KYRQIYEYIRDAIVSGQYGEGDKLPTQMELASRFNVSRLTVIHALRELEREGVLERRQGSGCYVGHKRKTQTRLLGLVAVYTPGPIELLADEIGHIVHQNGYELLWRTKLPEDMKDLSAHAEEQCALYKSLGIAGIFFMPLLGMKTPDYFSINREIVDHFTKAGIKVVLLDRDICEYPLHSEFDVIGIDSFDVGYVITKYLLDSGYSKIAFVADHKGIPTIAARIAGYKKALIEKGIKPENKEIHCTVFQDREEIRSLIQKTQAQVLFCVNDLAAAHLMNHLASLGVKVPEDIAVTGVDDLRLPKGLNACPLTTLRQPLKQISRLAARVMVDRLEDPNLQPVHIYVKGQLIVRQSCGASLRQRSTSKNE
ncbi:MAG: LacI family DNA-binding transcriptional regulator, partial [Planctomycetota bacterium]